jgi:hypothetical protein
MTLLVSPAIRPVGECGATGSRSFVGAFAIRSGSVELAIACVDVLCQHRRRRTPGSSPKQR